MQSDQCKMCKGMLVLIKVEHEVIHLDSPFLLLCTTTVLALSNVQMVTLHTSSRKPNTRTENSESAVL